VGEAGNQLMTLDEIGALLAQAGAHLDRQKTRGMKRVERKAYSSEQARLLMEALQKPIGGRL